MYRVDFLLIGAQKSGTTSLAFQLAQHPQICFCENKEPHFFSRIIDWQSQLAEYHQLFSPTKSQICGEASTSYTFRPAYSHTPAHLCDYNPHIKLIYIMRHPVKRIESHYDHRLIMGQVQSPPEVEIFRESAYIERSRYGYQLEPYLALFPRQNILLLCFEEFTANPTETLREISSFLGISFIDFHQVDNRAQNVSSQQVFLRKGVQRMVKTQFSHTLLKYLPTRLKLWGRSLIYTKLPSPTALSQSLQEELWAVLEGDVIRIETLLGRRLDIWRQDKKRLVG